MVVNSDGGAKIVFFQLHGFFPLWWGGEGKCIEGNMLRCNTTPVYQPGILKILHTHQNTKVTATELQTLRPQVQVTGPAGVL